jgi:2-methylfumaryl-CoA isomerase
VHCATGYPMITGTGSRAHPINQTLPAWDLACAYHAAFAITAAVARHRASGAGAELRIALSDIAFTAMSHLGTLTEAALRMPPREAIGNDIYGAFGRDFPTRDGRRVMVAAVSARQWQALVQACGLAEIIGAIEASLGVRYANEADRFEGREIIAGLVSRWIGARSLTDIAQIFDTTGVCWGLYQSMHELVRDDPRVSLDNPVFGEIDTPGIGRHLAAGAAARIADHERSPTRPAPLLGEHTDEVLRELLHLSDSAIAAMKDRGVIAGPDQDPLMAPGHRMSARLENTLVT